MLRRLALVEALHAGCPLRLLDEPFAGLDRDARAWLADEIAARRGARRGAAARARPRPADVLAAAAGHLCCAALGGAIAVLYAPPRVARPATAAAAGLALACVSCAALAAAAVRAAEWWARRSG
jgi:hypothetical protein